MTNIRPAGAADITLAVEVLEMASRGHLERGPWDFVFPDADERRKALALLADGLPSWCHHRVVRVAEADGNAAAALSAFEATSVDGGSLAAPLGAVFEKLAFPDERAAEVGPAMMAYLSCFPEFPTGVWIVENVGTLARYRRRGLVAALLDHALEDGRQRGYASAQIACLIGNQPAQRAYEQVGFRTVEERKSSDFEALVGVPGFLRMTLSL